MISFAFCSSSRKISHESGTVVNSAVLPLNRKSVEESHAELPSTTATEFAVLAERWAALRENFLSVQQINETNNAPAQGVFTMMLGMLRPRSMELKAATSLAISCSVSLRYWAICFFNSSFTAICCVVGAKSESLTPCPI